VHRYGQDTDRLAAAIVEVALERIRSTPPLDGPRRPEELATLAGTTITPDGLGWEQVLGLFTEVLAPACISVDFPRFLSFVPAAPTKASVLFDFYVSAMSVYGGSWLEGAGAVHAENQALAWLARLAGLPPEAGGCFVSGGTAGNLSGLVAARHTAAMRRPARPTRWTVLASDQAHSSVASAARVMDVDLVDVASTDHRLTGEDLAAAVAGLSSDRRDGVFAVVASAGTTNLGVVDDLAGVGRICRREGWWFHVDGAYGGAALAVPAVRDRFAGIELADSLVVDPHKWLFAPFDVAALLYRDPTLARAAHTQHAGYLEPITSRDEWNPADYAHHLSRRARGLPFWFSLAVHGTEAYSRAVERGIDLAGEAAAKIEAHPRLELVWGPSLSIVLFRRVGWSAAQYRSWSDRLLADGVAFVLPTVHAGETVLRLCFVNPETTTQDIEVILGTL
jgi:glutamate/tyrosine decarboxylase-like PLP-dependent enzyme